MAKGKRSRRPGGHPAKVAERRAREEERRAAGVGSDRLLRQLASEASKLTDPLEAEVWISGVLGALWEAQGPDEDDWDTRLGVPIVERLARMPGVGALITLELIAAVHYGELAELAFRLAEAGERMHVLPEWIDSVGEAEIIAAAIMEDEIYDDARDVFLEARHPDGEVHAVGVLIDNNFGYLARDIVVTDSIAEVGALRESDDGGVDLKLAAVDPAVAAAQIRSAMALSEIAGYGGASDEYAELRAFTIMRTDATNWPEHMPEHTQPSPEERTQLRDEFLAAPEGSGFAPGGPEAFVVDVLIDFCSEYVDGRPLRWSPSLMEMFMTSWLPDKILADEEKLTCAPHALDAWVRFAGRQRGIPAWAIEETQAAIPRWREEMVEVARANDARPASARPAP